MIIILFFLNEFFINFNSLLLFFISKINNIKIKRGRGKKGVKGEKDGKNDIKIYYASLF